MRKPDIPTDIRVHIDELLEQSGSSFLQVICQLLFAQHFRLGS